MCSCTKESKILHYPATHRARQILKCFASINLVSLTNLPHVSSCPTYFIATTTFLTRCNFQRFCRLLSTWRCKNRETNETLKFTKLQAWFRNPTRRSHALPPRLPLKGRFDYETVKRPFLLKLPASGFAIFALHRNILCACWFPTSLICQLRLRTVKHCVYWNKWLMLHGLLLPQILWNAEWACCKSWYNVHPPL